MRVLGTGASSGCQAEQALREVGAFCFDGAGLEALWVPAGLETISDSAFRCHSLRTVMFARGSRLRGIGCGAFCGTALEEFVAPASLRVLGQMALSSCYYLRRVVLNEGLEVLGSADAYPDGNYPALWKEARSKRSRFRRRCGG